MSAALSGALLAQGAAAISGAAAGVAVIGIANHFTKDRSLWPLPCCPRCGAASAPRCWIPVAGPVLGRAGCRACDAPQGAALATIVQLACAVLAVLLYRQYGPSWLLLSAALESFVLVSVAVIDFQHRLIPTLLVYPSLLFALCYSPLWPDLGLWSSLFGALLAFVIFFLLAWLARVAFGEGALGDGDVSLAALIGAICGYPMVVLALAIGALCGGIGALLLLLARRAPMGTTIPYGPFLVMGVLYVLLQGNTTHPLYPN